MLPIAIDLAGRRCVVLGGGKVAASKAATLVSEGARVAVITEELLAEMPAGIDSLEVRRYEPGDLDGAFLVVSAIADPSVNDEVLAEAERSGTWVNVVDDLERATVHLVAIHREGPVAIAVSTGGSSPALARHLRDVIAGCLPIGAGEAAEQLAIERRAVRSTGGSTEDIDWSGRIAELLGPPRRCARG